MLMWAQNGAVFYRVMLSWSPVLITVNTVCRSSPPDPFLGNRVLKLCSIFIEQPCQSVISIKLLCSFIEIALRHGCSPVNLLHIFRIPFPTNTSGGLLLGMQKLSTCIIYAVYTSISENKLEFPFFQLKHTLKYHFW